MDGDVEAAQAEFQPWTWKQSLEILRSEWDLPVILCKELLFPVGC